MTLAMDHFRAGRLGDALAAALNDVKAKPTDLDARTLLVDLLCFAGDLERADKQLETMVKLDAGLSRGVQAYQHILRGETARTEVFRDGRPPELLVASDPSVEAALQGMIALREGRTADASAAFAAAEEAHEPVTGTADGAAFEDFRDLDDRLGSVWEMIAADGRYLWVPTTALREIVFKPVEKLRDLVWRPAEVELRDGRRGEFHIPVLYPCPPEPTDAIRLGRETVWDGGDGSPFRGSGQRCVLIGEDDKDVLSIQEVKFAGADRVAVPESEDEPKDGDDEA